VTRLERLRARLDRRPLLVTGLVNVRYLTGLDSSAAALLVESERLRLFTDSRYLEAAKAVEGAEIVDVGRNLLATLATHLEGEVGFEAGHVTYAGYEALATGGATLVPTHGTVEVLRAVKEQDELDALRSASALSDRVFAELADERFVGRTEKDLAAWIDHRFRELGADGSSFPTIVGGGPNGALPHHHPSDRAIGPNEAVVVDFGCLLDGYCSDCTRTFATGTLPDELAQAYAVCLDAQERSLAAVLAGARCLDVDLVAREIVDATAFAGLFAHGLGHGVGMDIHEAPSLRPEAPPTAVLEAGNVVTVEPGIYLPGVGGVRIEDLVVVTADGPERLTRYTKDLIEVS
jgi:Xaa-Pro aminopeptidase